jgi:hypothetical protein
MHKARHLERRETLAYWPVKNGNTGETVGLVSNLSEEGVQIHSRHEFDRGAVLPIRIKVDAVLVGTDHISLTIENVWCQASGVHDLYFAGFKIVEISDAAKGSLKSLLAAFSFPAPEHGFHPR